MKNNPKISIIIAHFFGVNYIVNCLNSIFKSDYDNTEIIVVFNGNKDDSYKIVKEKFPQVITILNKKNLGFAKANNQGIKTSTGEIIFLLNDDTTIHKQLISVLSEKLTSSSKIGIVGPKIYYMQPKDKIWFAGGMINWQKQESYHLGRDISDGAYNDSEKRVDFITGCALMIKREVINKIGLLDETFFAFYEDSDWCLRARKFGYRIIYVPFGGVWHAKSATAGKTFFGQEKEKKYLRLVVIYYWRDLLGSFRIYKNRLIFFMRYSPTKYQLLLIVKSIFIFIPQFFIIIIFKIPWSIIKIAYNHLWAKRIVNEPKDKN